MKKKIVVGMSGGVDSSVAVELLQRAGYEVVGVTCRFHDDARTAQSVADAAAVCERFNIEHVVWDCMEAFEKNGLTISFYNNRERSVDEILPWDFIDIGVTKKHLIREWDKAKRGEVTPNCREKCAGCGANKYGSGTFCF